MSFSPIVIGTGLQAWSILKSTLPQQKSVFENTPSVKRDIDTFSKNFRTVTAAEDIVGNRTLLSVVLGAYGLGDDIDNAYFIKKVMTDGVNSPNALSNRLSDQRYKDLAKDFNFSPEAGNLAVDDDLEQATLEAYRDTAFDSAVGEINPDMRLALGFHDGLERIANRSSTPEAAWYQVLATPPVREVILEALGLPSQFANLDIDEQHSRIVDKAQRVFGTHDIEELATADVAELIVTKFLVRRQFSQSQNFSSLQIAMTLLSWKPLEAA